MKTAVPGMLAGATSNASDLMPVTRTCLQRRAHIVTLTPGALIDKSLSTSPFHPADYVGTCWGNICVIAVCSMPSTVPGR